MEEDKKDLEKQETDKEVPEKQEYNKKELDARLKEAVHRAGHRWRNRFHLELPFGFTGSVKGLVFFEGEYHLFCQWNPFSTEDKNKGWVEFKTRDFVYWSEPRLVLWPTGDDDRDGCGSGSAFINGGRLRILYTGRREEEGRRANHQILGTLTKEGVIHKDMVLLKEPPEGYTDLFQGPHFFVRNNHAYMVLGAQAEPAEDARGCALLYREEKGVAPESKTETFVAMKCYIDNWRWSGVPFYIRTGKCLPTRVTEVVVHFRPNPHRIFARRSGMENVGNQLVLRIQPDEGILLRFGMKVPGAGFHVDQVSMDFHYSSLGEKHIPDAYERLLSDCMTGDATLYQRGDAVEATWQYVQPILDAWASDPTIPLYGYPAGSWGPEQADTLLAADGHAWRYPCKNLTSDDGYCEL